MRLRGWYFAVGLLAGLLLLAAGRRILAQPYTFRGSQIEPAVAGADFTLTDQQGQAFRLSEQRGKLVLLFFGYTHCPDVCPVTLAEFTRIKADLGDQAKDVRFVFITVDPERDTVDALRAYMANFDPQFISLTSEREALEVVWKDYGVYQARQETSGASGYLVDHTARTYLIDGSGNLRATYPYEMTEADVVSDLKYLLRQGMVQ